MKGGNLPGNPHYKITCQLCCEFDVKLGIGLKMEGDVL